MTLHATAGFCHCNALHAGVRLLIFWHSTVTYVHNGLAANIGSKQLASLSSLLSVSWNV